MRTLTTLIALIWIMAVAWFGWTSLPQLPLDVSASDPATLEALNAARWRHGFGYGAAAFVPALAALWLGARLTWSR